MGLQMRFLGIIESFEQRTLVDRWTGITDIGYMESDGTDFFYEVRALLVAPTDPAINPIATFPGAVFTAKGRRFNLAGFPVFAGIERVARPAGGNLHRILPDFAGDRRRILVQLSRDLLE